MDRLPGFRDFLPEPVPASKDDLWSMDLRNHITDAWRQVAEAYGFREYDGPPLESLELYTVKSGDEIVEQLFNFTDKGEREVAMRPEMTPTLARLVAANERAYKKPFKWFSMPQLFRYERQSKGRKREHFQLNCDIIGEDDRAADAELIALLIDVLRALGLTHEDFVLRLSSRDAWNAFFTERSSKTEDEPAFYQIVDKLEREAPEESAKKLKAIGFDLDEVNGFITQGEPTDELRRITDNLAARGMGDFVKIDYGVIRGLAYYTGPVFEAFDKKGAFRAIAGGGRYDHLVKLVSGGKVDLGALGFGMGDVVLAELLKARDLVPEFGADLDVFVLVEDESERAASLGLIQQLREQHLNVDYPLTPMKGNKQFKRAQELGAEYTVRLERGLAVLKHLPSREELRLAPEEISGQIIERALTEAE